MNAMTDIWRWWVYWNVWCVKGTLHRGGEGGAADQIRVVAQAKSESGLKLAPGGVGRGVLVKILESGPRLLA